MKRIKEFFLLKDDKFFNLLGSLAECTHGCAQEFENFVMEFDGLDEKGKAERIKALGAFEKEGDRLVRTISEELYRSFITPIDREDIHLLASDLDTIIDMMEEVGKKFVYYRLDSTSTVMKCQASIAKQQMAVIMGAIGGLKASKNIKGEYLKVSELEDKADAIYENAMAKLFDDADGKVPVVKLPGGPVTPHDFRRTLRTHARNTLRCPFDVSEKLLAHSLGKIANTYDVGDLLDERREALLAWDTFVTALLAGKSETEAKAAALSVREGATVVAMPAKAVRS